MTTAHSNQPFFVVTDDAYGRMLAVLHAGEPFVKTYLTTCPHKNKADCKCPYFRNTLAANGLIVRNCNGVIKPVIHLTLLRQMMETH